MGRVASRAGRGAPDARVDAPFVADVRARIDPVVADTGFAFVAAEPVGPPGPRSTVVRYRAEPEAFAARFPGTAGQLRSEGSPLELWFALDEARRTVRVGLESWQPSALLAVVRAGPGAPPRRRELDDADVRSLPPEPALDRAQDLLRRLFEAAAPR